MVWGSLFFWNSFLSAFGSVTLSFISEGQFDSEGLLIDQSTLAWRVLLCPQWACKQLYHFLLNPGITLSWWMWERRGVYRNRGDKVLCRSSTQLDRAEEWESVGQPYREEGSYKWLLLWAKYSISWSDKVLRLPSTFVFLAWCNVCPQLTGRRRRRRRNKACGCDQSSRSKMLFLSFFSSSSSHHQLNVVRLYWVTFSFLILQSGPY